MKKKQNFIPRFKKMILNPMITLVLLFKFGPFGTKDERIEDQGKAMEMAQRENKAGAILREAEEEALLKGEFNRLAKERGLQVGGEQKDKADEQGEGKKSEGKKSKGTGGTTSSPSAGSGGKVKTDAMTYFFIIAAGLIWLMDSIDFSGKPILGFLGGPYIGFNFDFFGVMRTNLLAVGTTSLVVALLIYNTIKGVFERSWTFFLSFLTVMAIFQIWGKGWYEIPVLYANLTFAVFIIVFFYVVYKHHEVFGDYGSFMFMALFFSFFWINWGWYDNIKARIHVFYILLFGFVYLGTKLYNNPLAWHIMTPALIFADFYGYNLSQGYETFAYVPILVISVALICWMVNPGTWFPPIALSLVLAAMMGVAAAGAAPAQEQYQGTASFQSPQAAKASIGETISKIWSGWVGTTESRLEYATGGLYKSQVEKNQYEALGVNFDRVRAAQPRFYRDEPVVIWGTINSRTLSDPVVVKFNCFRWKQEKRIPLEADDKAEPAFPFVVYTLEEKDVECKFGKEKFEPGSNTVTLSAAHNFATSGYKKAYFIDNERFRAMTKESLDPLKEYGKTDKNPKTIFTNGPVDIDIVLQNLIPVFEAPDKIKPILGIKLTNRDKLTGKQGKIIGQWQGKINKINELAVVLPDTIELDIKSCLPVEFKDYTIDNCRSTCENVCKKSCEEFSDDPDKSDKIRKCESGCSTNEAKRCNEDCDALFKSDSKEITYKGYQIDTSKLRRRDDYKDIDRNKDFACRIDALPKILDSPVTERFIRVVARYDYEMQKTFTVQVASTPTLPSEQALLPDIHGTYTDIALVNTYINPSNSDEVKYSPIILQKAKEQGFDYLLIKAIIQKENPKWDAKDVHLDSNKQNVYGLMQVTEGTGGGICGATNWRTEAEANIQCGIDVLKAKCNEFKQPPCNALKPQCNSPADCKHPFGQKKEYCQDGGKDRLCKSDCQNNICLYEFTGNSKSRYYSGWLSALRAYNGWGAGGNDKYVEDIMNNYDMLKRKLTQAGP
ncbi:hypothetical protein HYY71_05505 [Candidatus Woesearchaeota archaeon]|nr:hypothetical protein [Candidatus Woesearchaeota archaeon]